MIKLLLSTSRLLCAALLLTGFSAFAQSAGFNTSYLVLSINGGSNTYYDLQASTSNADFNGANLGTFCQGTTTGLRFKGAEHNVFKCGGCDMTSTRVYYRIYLSASAPSGTFTSQVIPYASGGNNGCGGQDQQWASTGFNVNLLNGLAAGNYTLEVYSDASVTCSGGTVYAGNGGANYKANFSVMANVTYYFDNDGDGFGGTSLTQTSCSGAPAGYVSNNTDCNDSNANIYTFGTVYIDADGDNYDDGSVLLCHGAAEPNGFSYTTNGIDCDDTNAGIFRTGLLYIDSDGDGYNAGSETLCYGTAVPDGYTADNSGSDCDDEDNMVYRTADLYVDNDGDGFNTGEMVTMCYGASIPAGYTQFDIDIDCDDNTLEYVDADGDGFGSNTYAACGGVATNDDCDDTDDTIGAGGITYYADADEDGFGDPDTFVTSCTPVAGYVLNNEDCDDNAVHYSDADGDGFGSNQNVACGVTNSDDCNDNLVLYSDADNDSFGSDTKVACDGVANSDDCDDAVILFSDVDADGFGSNQNVSCGGVANSDDCDDTQVLYSDADNDGFGSDTKVACNGVTNTDDCDDAVILFSDVDGDGFGSNQNVACGGVANSDDCDDNLVLYSDADNDGFGSDTQVACDGVANSDDCDDAVVLFSDVDADGFGSNQNVACGGVANSDDCDDNQVQYADLDADGLGSDDQVACGVANSDDCDDNDLTNSSLGIFYADADGDGFGNAASSVTACTQPAGYVTNSSDCNDLDNTVFQNGVFYVDADGDGYNNGTTQSVCYGASISAGFVLADNGLDCNDSNASVYRAAQLFIDADGDGYTNGASESVCYGATVPAGYVETPIGADCDDSMSDVNPGHPEVLGNGVDDNCNGQTDEGGPQVFTQLIPSQCGTTLASISSVLGVVGKSNVTSYRFRITNLTTNAVQTSVRTTGNFQLTSFPSYDYATTYSIDVELQINGIWVGSYGPACNVSTPAILDEGGSASISPSLCGGVLPSLSTLIATTSLLGVREYRFRVTNTLTNNVQTIDRTKNWFSLTMLSSFNYGTTYSVEVAVKTNGDFSGFGAPCLVSSPAVPTLVNCDFVAPSPGTLIATVSLNRVTTHKFEITNLSDFTTQIITRAVNYFSFSYLQNYTPGGQYAVRVALMTSGSYSPFGEACMVTAPGGARSSVIADASAPDPKFRAVVYPNPYSESFAIDMDPSGDDAVKVKVYDMIGKLIEEREIAVDQVEVQQFGERYPSGVYNMVVTQGENIKTLRVVKR